ncbi:MAG: hypothetical protein HQM08_12810 [Candidatus Riflebacteria bacterium]|nr:hypothetical protein [Candidatus Riflebacteria bacterium]
MQINGISSNGNADLYKLMQNSQDAQLDLAKKMIKVGTEQKVSQSQADGKGKNIDLTA